MDPQELTERSRAVWGTGDYAPTSRQLEPAAQALVDALDIGEGQQVLDVAAGHGNCALAAARRGASVTATDFSPVMVEQGARRTRDAGVEVQWREADAADLPFNDGAFDRVTSTFGAIFAPERQQVARELVRVTAPGGRVGLTAWPPDGLIAGLMGVGSDGPARPEGAPDPFVWGDPDEVERLFSALGCELQLSTRTVTFTYPSWEAWHRDMEAHGMSVVARQTMDPDDYERMVRGMREHVAAADHGDGDAVAYDAEYLEIRVIVP